MSRRQSHVEDYDDNMANVLEKRIKATLETRQQRAILRRVEQPLNVRSHSSTSPLSSASQDSLIDFSSNDYLSLTTYPRLRSLYLEKLSTLR